MWDSTKRAANLKKSAAAKEALVITRTIRTTWSTTGYEQIVRFLLGPRYALSLVLVGDTTARTLNRIHRGKKTAANVLTFPLTRHSGEVFINIPKVRREAHSFGLSPASHAKFLLIHACLHLKGYPHGSTMEKAEQKLVHRFHLR